MKYKIMGIALVFLGILNGCTKKVEGETFIHPKELKTRELRIRNSILSIDVCNGKDDPIGTIEFQLQGKYNGEYYELVKVS